MVARTVKQRYSMATYGSWGFRSLFFLEYGVGGRGTPPKWFLWWYNENGSKGGFGHSGLSEIWNIWIYYRRYLSEEEACLHSLPFLPPPLLIFSLLLVFFCQFLFMLLLLVPFCFTSCNIALPLCYCFRLPIYGF